MKGGKKMSEYIIEGGKKVEGEVTISGSKNASLPIIAASILKEKRLYIMYLIYMIRK